MKQASRFDGLPFDPFSLLQDGLTAPEVDVCWRKILQALVIATMVVVIDEGINLLPEIARQILVLEQNAVLEGLVPSLDFTLRLRVVWSATNMVHLLIFQPLGQLVRASGVNDPGIIYRCRMR